MHDSAAPRAADEGDHSAEMLLRAGSNGCWCFIDDRVVLDSLARAGFDWIALDAQHGGFDGRALRDAGRSLAVAGHRFAIRVAAADAAGIGLALDFGASTVIVPQVDSVADAELVVRAAHYPPRGARSWGPSAPLWGLPVIAAEDAHPQVAVMIESAAAVEVVEQIARVDGVDLLFVGPVDLALSLGMPLDELLAGRGGVLERIGSAGRAAGIGIGAFAGTSERTRKLRELGFGAIAVTTDTAVITAGAEFILGESAAT